LVAIFYLSFSEPNPTKTKGRQFLLRYRQAKLNTAMRNCISIFCFILTIQLTFGQTPPVEYYELIKKADSLYEAKDYQSSAFTYSSAFKVFGWKGLSSDRYNAACSWALAGFPDSAIFNLERIALKANYTNYIHITTDPDLVSLHSSKGWKPLLEIIQANKNKAEANLNKPLVNKLDSIYADDQNYREMIADVENKYGHESKELSELWRTIKEKDSINLIKVEALLTKYGWLGPDEVGEVGNSTLFLVIQHSDLKTQEKYLPMMKEAVKNYKAKSFDLALLVDRVEMNNGRPQVYGSQITMKDGKYEIYKIIDEVNVNKRRAEVGLDPLEEYVKYWNIDYKLPAK
jgi:hypothetical protein